MSGPTPDDDDDESEQPTIAANNTITQPPIHDVQSPSPNLPGLSFAERRGQQERQETSWLRTPLWPLVHDHPDPESPGKPKRARHHESVNIAAELFPNGCDGSTNLLAGWHDYNPKTHEIYLGSTADFGASKMDFWLETMFGQGIALFMLPIFPCQPTSSRPPMA